MNVPPLDALGDQLRKAFPPKRAARVKVPGADSNPGRSTKTSAGAAPPRKETTPVVRSEGPRRQSAAGEDTGPPSGQPGDDNEVPNTETRRYPVLEQRVRKETPMTEEARTIYLQGARAFARGEFDEAAESFGQALALVPGHPIILANLGLAEYRLGRIEKAEEHLREAVANDLNAMEAWLTLGILCSEQGKLEGAVAALSQAVLLAPDDPRPRNHLGVAFSRLEWFDAAEAQLIRALELKDDYADGHFNLAVVYLRREPVAVELARRHYQRATDLGAPSDPLIEEMLGRAATN